MTLLRREDILQLCFTRTDVVASEEICRRCYRQINEIDFLETQVSFFANGSSSFDQAWLTYFTTIYRGKRATNCVIVHLINLGKNAVVNDIRLTKLFVYCNYANTAFICKMKLVVTFRGKRLQL